MTTERQPAPQPKRGLSVRARKIISAAVLIIVVLWVFSIGYSIWRASTEQSAEWLETIAGGEIVTAYNCVLHWELYIETKRLSPDAVHIENLQKMLQERGLVAITNFESGSAQEMLAICEGNMERLWSFLSATEQQKFPNVIELLYYRERLEDVLKDYDP